MTIFIFQDLMDYIGKNRPHVVILCGPFVDSKQPLIDQCETGDLSFDDIFNKLVKKLQDLAFRVQRRLASG